jgi:hypothetical protein
MNKNLTIACAAVASFVVLFVSCRKDGLNSATAQKIQYRWERISGSSATDYLDGRNVTWTVRTAVPGTYLEFGSDGYFSDIYGASSTKYQYAVDADKILYLYAGSSRATTPQYTDTDFVSHVDDHLLVLFHRKYFLSPAYNYVDEFIDSLKK